MTIPKKLDIFCIKIHYNKKSKLFVFDPVVTSKILYNLEILEPIQATGRLLNIFQLKNLFKKYIYILYSYNIIIPINKNIYIYIEKSMKFSMRHQDLGNKSNY
jgi:hypothetical protein